ncbi:MAG TPA: alpha/beta fold hydrolase [Phycisphaerae bacterium]|nr:alpha/beta fold hydrolase [Phycisphaerae bacterium]
MSQPLQHYFEIDVGHQRIAATLHRPEPGRYSTAAPVVVCAHGLTGTRVGSCYRFVTLARRLTQMNMACLRFDFRGCGESDGEFIDVTAARLVEDLRAAVAALDRAAGCDPTRLAVVASSYGAYSTALAVESLASARAFVFWAPVAYPKRLVERDMTPPAWKFLDANGWVEHFGLRMGRGFIDTLTDADAPALLAAHPRPLLVLHGRGDRHVPIEHGQAYVGAMKSVDGNSRLIELDTDDHGMRSVPLNDRIIDETTEWCRRFLHPET